MEHRYKNIFRSIPTLKTERLTLRKLERSDDGDMYEYACDPSVTRFLTWSAHPDKEYTHKYLSYIQSKYKSGEFRDWAVEYNGKMIGTCGFTSLDLDNYSGEIGYVISPSFANCGFASEAVKEIIAFGFKVLKLNRIEGRFISGNLASRRVMEKNGMTFEGFNRESMVVKGRFVSIGTCSILKWEWLKQC